MEFLARLVDSPALPGGSALVNPFAFEGRADGSSRALLTHETELAVHDLSDLLAGESAPTAVFPLPWPGWRRGAHSVSPDGTFAVFSGQRSVRAVAADGTTLWVYEHGCWDQRMDHPHTGDERKICPGIESGSCRISDDGRLVWAHVVDPEEYAEYWAVLDARDGRELARLTLESVASGSNHLSHPDGVHMGLGIGMGQDGVLVYWGRWDGERLTVHEQLNDGLDRILMDVHPAHPGFLTVEHYGNDLQLHALDGELLAEADAPAVGGDDEPQWDWACGFLDGDTVLATTGVEYAEDPDEYGTWLLDGRTLEVRGRVTYPTGTVDSEVRPLGDGTWLTYDRATETTHRWTL
ncbi:hypothetical protein [Streptomyces sp. NPDC101115]|uniref:hypothetical protein n=1 Tax=Streptomyces sp. NPDC101115 TaxID=3366106 RepID=UPI003830C1E3